MKATELKIGNWIKLFRKPQDELMTEHIIYSILYQPDVGYCISLVDGFVINIDTGIEPILLTEQWIKDLGFEENEDFGNWHLKQYKIYSKDGNNIGFEENEFCWYFPAADDFYSWIKKLKYVHQLQNLYFTLTGKELIKK